jgi:hypothetical protein
MTAAIAEPNLTDLLAETAAMAAQCTEKFRHAEQVVVELEQQHASLLSEVSAVSAQACAGAEITADLSDLAERAGAVARSLVEARTELAQREREATAATLSANKALFIEARNNAQIFRALFHASYRDACLNYGQLIETIAKLASLANACRMPSFGVLAEHKNTLADFNSEGSLNPLQHLLGEFEPTRETTMDKLAGVMSLCCLPLVPKILKKGKRNA